MLFLVTHLLRSKMINGSRLNGNVTVGGEGEGSRILGGSNGLFIHSTETKWWRSVGTCVTTPTAANTQRDAHWHVEGSFLKGLVPALSCIRQFGTIVSCLLTLIIVSCLLVLHCEQQLLLLYYLLNDGAES